MSAWNPRPTSDLVASERKAYLCGYSDGWHGYSFGSGDVSPGLQYRAAFDHGRSDRNADQLSAKP